MSTSVKVELDLKLETNSQAYRVLKRGKAGFRGSPYARPYLLAQVIPVHCHGCAYASSRKRGECDCGALELYNEWRRKVLKAREQV